MSVNCCPSEIKQLRDYANADILEAVREGVINGGNFTAIGMRTWQFVAILIMAGVDSGDGLDVPDCSGQCSLWNAIEGNAKEAILSGSLNSQNSTAVGISQGEFWFLKALAESF